ncbi:MAG: tetratricopeptide repeat protein [bacterium]
MKFRPFLLVSCLLWPSLVTAQEVVELSEYQLNANNEGVRALVEKDYSKAVGSFQSSLRLGEANITWLNLGRTYQKMGRCLDARDAYEKAKTAPPVASPTLDEVEKVRTAYASELPAVCPAVVTVKCDSGLTINGTPSTCNEPHEIPPGTHTFAAAGNEQTLDLAEGEFKTIAIEAQVSVTPPTITPAPNSGFSTAEVVGLGIAGLGGATMLTALILDQTYVGTKVDAAEQDGATQTQRTEATDAQGLNKVVLFTGVGLAAVGGLVYAFGPEDSPQATVWLAPSPSGVAFGGQF